MDKKKILIFGATGMAGHVIYLYLKDTGKYEVTNAVFRTRLTSDSIVVDVTNKEAVRNTVFQVCPDIIINGVGVLVKGSKAYPDNAILLNAYFPHALKKWSDEVGAKLIHISTDCVFSGKKGHYTETDFRDADDVYGRSKALGEIVNAKDLTIRTSIVGPELKRDGEGLFHWFMNQHGEINGYASAIWGGVTTLELAKAIDAALEKNVNGLIQLSNGLGISKYELLCLFKEIWHKEDVTIRFFEGNKIDKSIARSDKFDYPVPDYSTMLFELYDWMQKHANLYSGNYPIR